MNLFKAALSICKAEKKLAKIHLHQLLTFYRLQSIEGQSCPKKRQFDRATTNSMKDNKQQFTIVALNELRHNSIHFETRGPTF